MVRCGWQADSSVENEMLKVAKPTILDLIVN